MGKIFPMRPLGRAETRALEQAPGVAAAVAVDSDAAERERQRALKAECQRLRAEARAEAYAYLIEREREASTLYPYEHLKPVLRFTRMNPLFGLVDDPKAPRLRFFPAAFAWSAHAILAEGAFEAIRMAQPIDRELFDKTTILTLFPEDEKNLVSIARFLASAFPALAKPTYVAPDPAQVDELFERFLTRGLRLHAERLKRREDKERWRTRAHGPGWFSQVSGEEFDRQAKIVMIESAFRLGRKRGISKEEMISHLREHEDYVAIVLNASVKRGYENERARD